MLLRVLLCTLLVSLSTYTSADSLPAPLPDTIYFSVTWCPKETELTELSKHLELTMYGCCIRKATVLPDTKLRPEVLLPWSDKIYIEESHPMCWGETEQQKTEKEQIAKQEEDVRREKAPEILKNMPNDLFCATYGRVLRHQKVYQVGEISDLEQLVKIEARRRKFKFDDSFVMSQKIKLGLSECQLFASWDSAYRQNETVGSWGVHIQHIYGDGRYVYTKNGRVTSWQQ